mmetsp:Transcript_145922/g.406485  ORF Transcript_145922/g.406485 Transcript_145922/m.406485 type:complete len:229 (-) Transcript_145922:205-891(-)
MQDVELLGHELTALALEGGALGRPVHLHQVGLDVWHDALLPHQLFKRLPVERAGKDAWRRRAELNVDRAPHPSRPPSALRKISDFLRSTSAVHRRRRVGEDGLACTHRHDVLPDLGRVLVRVDGRHTILAESLSKPRHRSEVLLQASRDNEHVVVDALPSRQCEAVVGRIKACATVLDPLHAQGHHHLHRTSRVLGFEAKTTDHGPVRLIEVRVPRLNDRNLAVLCLW